MIAPIIPNGGGLSTGVCTCGDRHPLSPLHKTACPRYTAVYAAWCDVAPVANPYPIYTDMYLRPRPLAVRRELLRLDAA